MPLAGMKSRFTDVTFEDFDAAQLRQIWDRMLEKYNPEDKGWRVETEARGGGAWVPRREDKGWRGLRGPCESHAALCTQLRPL